MRVVFFEISLLGASRSQTSGKINIDIYVVVFRFRPRDPEIRSEMPAFVVVVMNLLEGVVLGVEAVFHFTVVYVS